jgi:hypothetical protein
MADSEVDRFMTEGGFDASEATPSNPTNGNASKKRKNDQDNDVSAITPAASLLC